MSQQSDALLRIVCPACGKAKGITSTTVSYTCYCVINKQPKGTEKWKKPPRSIPVTDEQRAQARKLEEAAAARKAAQNLPKATEPSTRKPRTRRSTCTPTPSSTFKREQRKREKQEAKISRKEKKKSIKKKKILKRLFVRSK